MQLPARAEIAKCVTDIFGRDIVKVDAIPPWYCLNRLITAEFIRAVDADFDASIMLKSSKHTRRLAVATSPDGCIKKFKQDENAAYLCLLRRSTKAETEVRELQNYRHARHNLKKVIALKVNTSAQKSVTANQRPHCDAAKLQIFQTPANLLRHAESKIKTATERRRSEIFQKGKHSAEAVMLREEVAVAAA